MLLGAAVALALLMRTRGARGTHRVAKERGTIGSLEGDRQVLAALQDAGADLTKVTEVNFYLYFDDRAAADVVAEEVATPPLTATVSRGADDSSWLCFVTGKMVPSESAIHAMSARLVELAHLHNGEYDGWEAAVTE